MSKFVALVMGIVFAVGYQLVYQGGWFMFSSGELIMMTIGKFSAVKPFLFREEEPNIDTLMVIIRAIVVSVVCAIVFGMLLAWFKTLKAHIVFIILGFILGLSFVMLPDISVMLGGASIELPGLLNYAHYGRTFSQFCLSYILFVMALLIVWIVQQRQLRKAERFWFR